MTVVLVGGALCNGNASRNGREDEPWLAVDRLSGAGAGARPGAFPRDTSLDA